MCVKYVGCLLQNRTLQQERDLEDLESKVGQLEHVRVKQAEKITGLKGELEHTVRAPSWVVIVCLPIECFIHARCYYSLSTSWTS